MFQIRFVLLIVLIPLAGILGLLGGTSVVHAVVMGPYEQAVSTSASALSGSVARFANETVDAVARAASDTDVHTALTAKKMSPQAEAMLLSPAGGFGAPSFALLIGTDGAVVASAGAESKLPTPLTGFPVVAEALTGVARDGLWIQDGKAVHVVAAAIWEGASPAGGVVLGWPWNGELAAAIGRGVGAPVFVVGTAASGAGGVGPAGSSIDPAVVAKREPFGEPTPTLGPLPILVPERARYSIASVPLYPGEGTFAAATVIDRDPAYAGLASLQVGILGLTTLLGLLVLVIVVMTMNGVKKPLDIILDHLSQVQQGNNVGILPEAGLSGPFLRLGKQINAILQAMPSTRPGGVAPMGFGGGSFDGAPPTSSPGFSGGFGSDPGLGMGGLASESSGRNAIPSTSTSPVSQPPAFTPPAVPTPPPQPLSMPPTTAAGGSNSGAPTSGIANLFDDGPDPLAAFRVPATKPPAPTPPPAPQPSFDAAEEDLPHGGGGMQPEATVMFQVPESLLQASAAAEKPKPSAARSPSGSAPKPMPQAPFQPSRTSNVDDNRTVVAQVPQELLATIAPKNDVDASDEAHYKEVYEKFVQTRIDCAEDTSDLSYERFVAKLLKNRQQIVDKHKAKSVRFQVYVKDGKAALRALPVRD